LGFGFADDIAFSSHWQAQARKIRYEAGSSRGILAIVFYWQTNS